ncbi:MAG: protein translocase subunit SecD, partial [Planctomycetes bacterium]|nr:protein translocase subunit SecD [Planctomycetota bacterium]
MTQNLNRRFLLIAVMLVVAGYFAWPGVWPLDPEQYEKPFFATRRIRLDIDLAGGARLRYKATQHDIKRHVDRDPDKEVLAQTIATLTKRLDPDGVKNVRIQQLGATGVEVTLPGVRDEEANEADRLIRRTGDLRFLIVETAKGSVDQRGRKAFKDDPNLLADGKVPGNDELDVDYRWYREKPIPPKRFDFEPMEAFEKRINDYKEALAAKQGFWVLCRVPRTASKIFTGKELNPDYLRIVPADDLGNTEIAFRPLGAAAENKLEDLTSSNVGKQMAIILDDVVTSAPTIRSRIKSAGVLTGFQPKEQRDVLAVLKAGALPVKLVQEGKSFVGPSQGQDAIDRGVWAVMLGLIAVLVFMVGYYALAGVVANLGLAVGLALILGIFGLFNVSLSLPGIAGLILTVGMAVDANILIFERVREERERGVALQRAFENGYARAFWTIFDSNLTTLLTAVFLRLIGTGPLAGFATTLMVGILVSMFTALYFTRTVFGWLIKRGIMKEYQPIVRFPRTAIPFMRIAPFAVAGSLVVIAVGMVYFGLRGADNFGIDFQGGQKVVFALKDAMQIREARQLVAAYRAPGESQPRFAKFDLQQFSLTANAATGTEARQFEVRQPVPADITPNALAASLEGFKNDIKTAFREHLVPEGDVTRLTIASNPAPTLTLTFTPVTRPGLALDDDESRAFRDALQGALAKRTVGSRTLGTPAVEPPAEGATDWQLRLEAVGGWDYFQLAPAAVQALREEAPLAGGGKVASVRLAPTEAPEEPKNHRIAAAFNATAELDLRATAPLNLNDVERAFRQPSVTLSDAKRYEAFVCQPLDGGTAAAATHFLVRGENVAFTASGDKPFTPQKMDAEAHEIFKAFLGDRASLVNPIVLAQNVGPEVATDLMNKAGQAMVLSLLGILVYVRFRFAQWRFGVAAVIAVFHDVLITLGAYAFVAYYDILDLQINLTEVAALLTIIGYSINDTIVVYDRVR